jgi:hypothetical protein
MTSAKLLLVALSFTTLTPKMGIAQEQWPPQMLQQMECLKRHGLIQGTVTDMRRGDAHFAPDMRETTIGGRSPTIRYNGQFVEGKTNLSPDIIKLCSPNTTLRKGN